MSNWPSLRFALTSFCLGMIGLHLAVFWLVRSQVVAGLPDFTIFYAAGRILSRGQGSVLYSDDVQRKTQQEFTSEAYTRKHPLPYNHPPFEAVPFIALAHVSYLRAYALWFVVNLLLLGGCVYLMSSWLPTLRSTFPEVLLLAPLAFFPIAYALMQGQDSILLLTLYCLAYDAFRRTRDLRAGLYLGLGLFKFHLVLPFALILLVGRRWRAVGGVILSACFDLAISWGFVGWKELLYYPHYALQVNRERPAGVIAPENMPNLRGLLTGWSGSSTILLALNVILLIVSLCLIVWAARRWHPGNLLPVAGWNSGFSIAMFVTFLVGYHSYNQDMSILLLPTLLAFDRIIQTPGSDRGYTKLFVGLMFFSPLYLILTLHFTQQNLFALVLLGFVACLASSAAAKPLALAGTDTTRTIVPPQ